jgi:hypothetical protein
MAIFSASYYNLLGSDLTYKAANFPHLKAAETEFLTVFSTTGNQSAAATAAFVKFVTEGGVYVDPTTNADVILGTAPGQAFLASADGVAFSSKYATAIATAASTGSIATSTLLAQMSSLSAYGFWSRPSFEAQEDNTALLRLMSEAIVNTENPAITPAMCVRGNTQADLQGTPVRACQLAWSARKTAIPVSFGDLPPFVNGTYARVGQGLFIVLPLLRWGSDSGQRFHSDVYI